MNEPSQRFAYWCSADSESKCDFFFYDAGVCGDSSANDEISQLMVSAFGQSAVGRLDSSVVIVGRLGHLVCR